MEIGVKKNHGSYKIKKQMKNEKSIEKIAFSYLRQYKFPSN